MIEEEFFQAGPVYHLILALHLLGVLLWAGGLLHASALPRSRSAEIMARTAQTGVTLTVLTGLTLAFQGGWLARGWWLYAKIFLVLTLIPVTLFLKRASESEQGDAGKPLADFGFRAALILILGAILFLSVHKSF